MTITPLAWQFRLRTALWRAIGRIAFNRIVVLGHDAAPAGPVVYVATHRNGALDAAPYVAAVPEAVPMVSAQLHRLPLGRLLFNGIAVARTKDRERGIEADNTEAVRRCIELLATGGALLIMPEGTSTLGPEHLPFQRGAARIVRAALKEGIRPAIVPLGVHYEDATQWQSRVEVLVGEPYRPQPEQSLKELHDGIVAALLSVGANFKDEEAQRRAETLAYAATLGTRQSYALALKRFERGIPGQLGEVEAALRDEAGRDHLALHQGVPLTTVGPTLLYAAYWLLLTPVVAAFWLSNAPSLCAGYLASRKLPDDRNVIAFWRLVAALPVGAAWSLAVLLALSYACGPACALAYCAVTVAGIAAWYRWRKLGVALVNRVFHAGSRGPLLTAYRKLLRCLSDDTTA